MDNLIGSLVALWGLSHPGPENLFSAPAFRALEEACKRRYGQGSYSFALYNILRSVGAPFGLPNAQRHLATTPEQAAAAIERSFTRSTTVRRHLCPLDLADDLPELRFGPARVAHMSADELGRLFAADKLARAFPGRKLNLHRLAQVPWLVVEEETVVDVRSQARATPALFVNLDGDLGEIHPHQGRFPQAVSDALFNLLLAEWEEWACYAEVNWRGFQIPWVYTVDEDLCVRPHFPPDPDTLTWEPWIVDDEYQGQIELERPTSLPLDDKAAGALLKLDDFRWHAVQQAQQTPLFITPVAHFLVQAFHEEGIDELLAHITTIEAALGLESDYQVPRTDPFPKVRATKRLRARIAAILDETAAADRFNTLFNLRSAFIHGRVGIGPISSEQRIEARRLARRVSAALIDLALCDRRPREEVLFELLRRGLAMGTV